MKEKASKDFWENNWTDIPFASYHGIEKYLASNKKINCLFKKYLKKGGGKILEIGCAGGKHLIFFAKEFNYDVYGIDYSEKGAALAQKNLKTAGVTGTIFCQDVLKTSLPEKSFDVVYSMGLIEHFENPADIIDAHIKLLKSGGILIMTIPNFKDSLYLYLFRIMGKAKTLLTTHNQKIMDKDALRKLLDNKIVNILALDYCGPIDLSTVFSDWRSRPMLYLAHIFNQVLGYVTFFMPASQYFSPMLVLISKKA